jgi:predicted O-methyltransferase YrrM
MFNDEGITVPQFFNQINQASQDINFTMPSDLKTGTLLRSLAASKPGGKFLELGTGTGLSLTWIAEGADPVSTITSIDNTELYQEIAKRFFKEDQRITFVCVDGNEWLSSYNNDKFDLIFADGWPGKFSKLEEALSLVKTGGFYLIDDLLPQPNWPEGHQKYVDKLIEILDHRQDFVQTAFKWSTGLTLYTKVS